MSIADVPFLFYICGIMRKNELINGLIEAYREEGCIVDVVIPYSKTLDIGEVFYKDGRLMCSLVPKCDNLDKPIVRRFEVTEKLPMRILELMRLD